MRKEANSQIEANQADSLLNAFPAHERTISLAVNINPDLEIV